MQSHRITIRSVCLLPKGLTLIRLPDVKSCFLSNSTDDVPKPAELVKLLVSERVC